MLKETVSELRDRRTKTRRRIEEVFSRDVLGSILVSLALSKVVESSLVLVAPGPVARLGGWIFLSIAFVALFVMWERAARVTKDAAESAAGAAEEVTKKD